MKKAYGRAAVPATYPAISALIAVVTISVGIGALAGWFFNVGALTSLGKGWASMKPNTAIAFIAAGLALWLRAYKEHLTAIQRILAIACSALTSLIGVISVGEYLLPFNTSLDELAFRKTLMAPGVAHAGRPAFSTALGLGLVGFGLLTVDLRLRRRFRYCEWLAVGAILIGFVALLGYVFGGSRLYQVYGFTSIAVHTASLLLLLGIGILSLRPQQGLMAIITSDEIGGFFGRRILPLALLFPMINAWIRLYGQRQGWYGTEVGLALNAGTQVCGLVVVLWLSAFWLNRTDQARRSADQQLLLNEERMRVALRNSHIVVFNQDCNLRYTWISNPRLGWADKGYVGKTDAEVLGEEKSRELTLIKLQVLATGTRIRREIAIESDGQRHWFDLTLEPLRNSQGEVVGITGACVDITTKIQTELALREREDRYRDLVESSHDLICTHDLNGKLLSVNSAAAKTLEYEVFELLETPMREIIVPAFREQFDQYLVRIGRRGRDKGFMAVLTRSGEQRIWQYDNILRTDGASPIVRGMAQDVTERILAERRLRESEARLRLLVHAANIGLFDWDLITDQIYFSPEWKSQIGYAQHEIPDRLEEWQSRVHPDDLEQILQRVRTYLANPQGQFEAEFRFRHKTGGYRWILAQADAVRDATGTPVRLLGCHLDITERKQEEESLRAQGEQLRALSSRLQQIREEERTIVARDLHDQIGQILTAVKMDIAWLAKHLPADQTTQNRLQLTALVLKDALHSVRTICSGLRPGVLDDLGLAAAIEWQANEFSSRTGIACHVSVAPADPEVPSEQATAIFRIFQEALTNVARHAGASSVRAQLREENGDVEMVLEDDGRGIRESELAGSLGILGMKERAQACGGVVQVFGLPGQGTKVTVRMPRTEQSEERAHTYSG